VKVYGVKDVGCRVKGAGRGGWRYAKCVFVIFLCMLVSGCGSQWKRKFVRKKTANQPEQIFTYEPQAYKKEPNDVLYKRHFIFWKAWTEELVTKLGKNRSGDIRSFEGALSHLSDMKKSLTDQKAAELDEYLKKMSLFCDRYKSRDFDIVRAKQMRQDLDRLMLNIDKAFRYSRVKEYIK
jgi:hypothetical protein